MNFYMICIILISVSILYLGWKYYCRRVIRKSIETTLIEFLTTDELGGYRRQLNDLEFTGGIELTASQKDRLGMQDAYDLYWDTASEYMWDDNLSEMDNRKGLFICLMKKLDI